MSDVCGGHSKAHIVAITGKLAVSCTVQYNEPPPSGRTESGDLMLEEMIQKADAEFERIQRLRGYL